MKQERVQLNSDRAETMCSELLESPGRNFFTLIRNKGMGTDLQQYGSQGCWKNGKRWKMFPMHVREHKKQASVS